ATLYRQLDPPVNAGPAPLHEPKHLARGRQLRKEHVDAASGNIRRTPERDGPAELTGRIDVAGGIRLHISHVVIPRATEVRGPVGLALHAPNGAEDQAPCGPNR